MQILILDSDQNLSDLVNREFETALVHYVADREIGLKIASEKQFDLIVMDSAILKTDALSVVKELREQKVLAPILLIMEEDSVRNIVYSLDAGANDCITKPFEFRVIAARMKALIRRSKWDLCAEVRHGHVGFGPVPGWHTATATVAIVPNPQVRPYGRTGDRGKTPLSAESEK